MIKVNIQRGQLVAHSDFAQWLNPSAPVDKNGAFALIWAIDADVVGEEIVYKVTLSPYVDVKAILPQIRSNVKPLGTTVEGLARAPRIVLRYPKGQGSITLTIGSLVLPLHADDRENISFADTNSALLFAPIAHVDAVRDWLRYTARTHNLQTAVIVFRSRSDIDEAEQLSVHDAIIELTAALEKENILKDAIIVDCDLPLGRLDEASIREPYLAPDAPNKIKMVAPAPDPWLSDFSTAIMHELMRERYLHNAKAVLHISPYDLLDRPDGLTVFDAVASADDGYIQLHGQKCYTWRIRENAKASFGDHIVKNVEDNTRNRGWIVVPNGPRKNQIWNPFRVGAPKEDSHPEFGFWRAMGMRHDGGDPNVNLAPRASLVLDDALTKFMAEHFPGDPVLPPEPQTAIPLEKPLTGRRLIITTMKNEGPFILEWIAYHRAIGFTDFLVYTNDCTDGTDTMHDLLQEAGVVVHKDNPYRNTSLKPQHAAFFDAQNHPLYEQADWVICMDVDEFLNIHVGDGHLDDLLDAIGDANMISVTWRLFGNSDVVAFEDRPIIEQFNQCTPQLMRSPHQAWGVKTLFRNLGLFRKMGVHRPKGLVPETRDHIKWVNGSGAILPEKFIRNAWRVSLSTYGYDLVSMNHYALRSAESFVVKRDRGRVNHVNRDQGLNYWFRMNHNIETDDRIKAMIPKMEAERQKLLELPGVRQQHDASVRAHSNKIKELLESEKYQEFFDDINSERMRRLSRISPRFGMNVFVAGPQVISDEVIAKMEKDASTYFNVQLPANR